MNVTEKLNLFIKENGGNERDALNISLTRYEALRLQFVQAMKDLKEANEKIEQLENDLEMVGAGF
jgi:predicted  nucleic acid-binding Zn-ribbon protein